VVEWMPLRGANDTGSCIIASDISSSAENGSSNVVCPKSGFVVLNSRGSIREARFRGVTTGGGGFERTRSGDFEGSSVMDVGTWRLSFVSRDTAADKRLPQVITVSCCCSSQHCRILFIPPFPYLWCTA